MAADATRHQLHGMKVRRAMEENGKGESEGDALPPEASKRVMELARKQQEEIAAEEDGSQGTLHSSLRNSDTGGSQSNDYDDNDDGNYMLDDDEDFDGTMVRRHGDFIEVHDTEVQQEDEAALAQFMPAATETRQTLGDIIAAKIREREAKERAANAPGGGSMYSQSVSEKVTAVYSGVGTLLTRWKAGKLPKAFKIIPALRTGEVLLRLSLRWRSRRCMQQRAYLLEPECQERSAILQHHPTPCCTR